MSIETVKLTPGVIGRLIVAGIADAAAALRVIYGPDAAGAIPEAEIDSIVEEAVVGLMFARLAGKRVQTRLRPPRKRGLINTKDFFEGVRDEMLLSLRHAPDVHNAAIRTFACHWRNAYRESIATIDAIRTKPNLYSNRWPDVKIDRWDPYKLIEPEFHDVVRATEIAFFAAMTLDRLAASDRSGYYIPRRGIGREPSRVQPDIDEMILLGKLSDRAIATRAGVSRSTVLRRRRALQNKR